MSRELRQVPPSWQHPKRQWLNPGSLRYEDQYVPMDKGELLTSWLRAGLVQSWWCVYETVSEGTPVTPPFETKQELIEYLVANGDFWDQRNRHDYRCVNDPSNYAPWSRKAATTFVMEEGWCPSMTMDAEHGVRLGHNCLGD